MSVARATIVLKARARICNRAHLARSETQLDWDKLTSARPALAVTIAALLGRPILMECAIPGITARLELKLPRPRE